MSQQLRGATSNKLSANTSMSLLPYVALVLIAAALLRLMLLYCHYASLPPPTYFMTATSRPTLVYQYLLASLYAIITVAISSAMRPITTLLADLQAHCTMVPIHPFVSNVC